jgi:hypothetical protein
MKIQLSDNGQFVDWTNKAVEYANYANQAANLWNQVTSNSRAAETTRYNNLILAIKSGQDGPFIGTPLNKVEQSIPRETIALAFGNAARDANNLAQRTKDRVHARYARAFAEFAQSYVQGISPGSGQNLPGNNGSPFGIPNQTLFLGLGVILAAKFLKVF